MTEPFILLDGELNWRGAVQPEVPANASQVLQNSTAETVLSVLSPVSNVISNATGAANVDGRTIASQLRFVRADRPAELQLLVQATALRRTSGLVDVSLKTRAAFSAPYRDNDADNDPWSLRSMFQDQVSFAVWPADPSLVNINPSGVSPSTNLKEVSYSNSVTWSVGAGFQADGGSVSADYSTEVSADAKASDFELSKSSSASTGRVEWVAQMRNLYSGSQPDTEGYDPQNALSIVVRGPFTTWLESPPAAAQRDLDLEFLAGYTSASSDLASRQVNFAFEARQRLIHAQVVGRSGPSWARVGGKALVVPYHVIYRGSFTLDLAAHAFRNDGGVTTGYNCKAQVPPDPFQNT